jgi:hypothetical protein
MVQTQAQQRFSKPELPGSPDQTYPHQTRGLRRPANADLSWDFEQVLQGFGGPPLVRNSEAVFLITPSRLWRREPAAQRAELGVEAVAPLLPFWRSPQVVRSCGPSVDSVGIGDSWKFGSLR